MEAQTVKTVQIDGYKNYFNSKTALDKFKQAVKSNNNFDLLELSKRFVREGYQLELVSSSESGYKFNVKQQVEDKPKTDKRRDILRAKIYNMSQMRTNAFYQKAKSSSNVPEDILSEYKKLIKISKVPIPEPSEILDNPDQYKPIVSMVLGNSMMKTLPQSHPYVKYFKLLAKQLGAEEPLPVPTKNFLGDQNMQIPNNLEQMINMAGPTDVKGNVISNDANAETDSEGDSIEV